MGDPSRFWGRARGAPAPQPARPGGRPPARGHHAHARLPSNAPAARPARPGPAPGEGAGNRFYLFLLLASPELDAQEQQQEEKGEAAGGQVAQPPPRRPPA